MNRLFAIRIRHLTSIALLAAISACNGQSYYSDGNSHGTQSSNSGSLIQSGNGGGYDGLVSSYVYLDPGAPCPVPSPGASPVPPVPNNEIQSSRQAYTLVVSHCAVLNPPVLLDPASVRSATGGSGEIVYQGTTFIPLNPVPAPNPSPMPSAAVSPVGQSPDYGQETSTNETVSLPGGVMNGDLLVAYGMSYGVDLTPPAGFVSIQSVVNAGSDYGHAWYKVANNEPPSYVWNGGYPTVVILAFRGARVAAPIDLTGTAAGSSADAMTLPALGQTSAPGETYLAFYGSDSNNSQISVPGGGLTAITQPYWLPGSPIADYWAIYAGMASLPSAGMTPGSQTASETLPGGWAAIALTLAPAP